MGITVEMRQISFEKWCIKKSQDIVRAALSALGIFSDPRRISGSL